MRWWSNRNHAQNGEREGKVLHIEDEEGTTHTVEDREGQTYSQRTYALYIYALPHSLYSLQPMTKQPERSI
jgi:hypothetical protein